MIGPADILWGGLVPAVAAAAAFVSVWKLTGRASLAWMTGLFMGYLIGSWSLGASKSDILSSIAATFRPHEARDWLPLVMLLSMVSELVAINRSNHAFAWLLRAAVCLFLPWRLLTGSAYLPEVATPGVSFDLGTWSRYESLAWLGGIAVLLCASWTAISAQREHQRWKLRSLLALLVAIGGAVTLALSGSITYGQLLGLLTASLAGCSLVAAFVQAEQGPETAAGPLVVSFGAILVLAHFFSELRLVNAVLLLASMNAAIGWLVSTAKAPPGVQTALRCLVCLIPLTISVVLAAMDFSATQIEAEGNPYLNFQP